MCEWGTCGEDATVEVGYEHHNAGWRGSLMCCPACAEVAQVEADETARQHARHPDPACRACQEETG